MDATGRAHPRRIGWRPANPRHDPRTIGHQLNAAIGWRALRWHTRHHQVGDLALDIPHFDAHDGVDEADWVYQAPPPIQLAPSPAARWLWAGLWYSAVPGLVKVGGIDVEPSISLELQDDEGDPLDGPITWDTVNGYLALGEARAVDRYLAAQTEAGSPAEGVALYFRRGGQPLERFVQTGWRTSSISDEPRLLELPEERERVQLVLTTPGVRILDVVWAEAYLAQL